MLDEIFKDPYYRELHDTFGRDFIDEAGFYENNWDENTSLNYDYECTPYHFLKDALAETDNPCIILATGSFNPLHDGHVEMVFKAKEACMAAGYDVIGGYFAPDHDKYVSTKPNSISINHRIELINSKIKHVDWLAVDPWMGLFCPVALNFTQTIERLQKYLYSKLHCHIPIFFVCGGDNARFALTFKLKGHCVIVDRPDSQETLKSYRYSLVDNKRILYIYNDNNSASKNIRALLGNPKREDKIANVRLDWRDPRTLPMLNLVREHYKEIVIQDIERQRNDFKDFPSNTITLDSMMERENKLEISRRYDVFGIKHLGFVNRPGSEPLNDQIAKLPLKKYFLADDDIHTGGTINFAKKWLQDMGIEVPALMCFVKSNKYEETLDIRDLFYDTHNSGLIIDNKRFLYAYPYVCPYTRASIEKPMEFSMNVWKINMEYYTGSDTKKYETCKKHYLFLKSLI